MANHALTKQAAQQRHSSHFHPWPGCAGVVEMAGWGLYGFKPCNPLHCRNGGIGSHPGNNAKCVTAGDILYVR